MQNTKKILKDPRTYYVIALLGIIFFPPINETYAMTYSDFLGWYFISLLGGDYKINIPYIAIELFIVSVIYFIYRKKG